MDALAVSTLTRDSSRDEVLASWLNFSTCWSFVTIIACERRWNSKSRKQKKADLLGFQLLFQPRLKSFHRALSTEEPGATIRSPFASPA